MKTIPIKLSGALNASLAHPLTPAGDGVVHIVNVPDEMQPGVVCLQVQRVCWYPSRDTIDWAEIEGKPQGTLIR